MALLTCQNCGKDMGMLSHGKCEHCNEYCGCSFDPTSKNDYCSYHWSELNIFA